MQKPLQQFWPSRQQSASQQIWSLEQQQFPEQQLPVSGQQDWCDFHDNFFLCLDDEWGWNSLLKKKPYMKVFVFMENH